MDRFQQIGEANGQRVILDHLTGEITTEPVEQLSAAPRTFRQRARDFVTDGLMGLGLDAYDARGASETVLGRPFARPEADGATQFMEGMGALDAATFLGAAPGAAWRLGLPALAGTSMLNVGDGVVAAQEGHPGAAAASFGYGLLDAAPFAGPAARGAGNAMDAIDEWRYVPRGAFATHEPQPYGGLLYHLPGAGAADDASRRAFAADPRSQWFDESGEDVLYRAIGANQRGTVPMTGRYEFNGVTEANPGYVARVDASPEEMQAIEAFRGLVDAQGATPWTRLREPGGKPTIFVPKDGPGSVADMDALEAAGSRFGFQGAYDVGDGYVLTTFDDTVGDTSRAARRAIGSETGMRAVRTTRYDGPETYPGYEGDWERGAFAAASSMLERIRSAPENVRSALQSDPAVRAKVMDRLFRDAEAHAAHAWGGIDPELHAIRQTIATSDNWIDDLSGLVQNPDSILMRHLSSSPRDVVDPAMKFTSRMRGNERQLAAAKDYPDQSYWGVNVGQPGGYKPENGLGNAVHSAEAPRSTLYDISTDPQGLRPIAADLVEAEKAELLKRGSRMADTFWGNRETNLMMQEAKRRGFLGLLAEDHPQGSMATTFWPITPKEYRTGR